MIFLRNLPPALSRILIVCVVIALLVGFDVLPFLRGGDGWQWPRQVINFGVALPFLLILIIYLLGAFWLGGQGKPRWVVLWSFLGAAVLPLLVIGLRHADPLAELYYRTVSPTATGPYFAAGRIDWTNGAWYDWSAIMFEWREISRHVALSPPGLPLLQRLLNNFLGSLPVVTDTLDKQLLPLQCHNYSVLEFTPPERASAIFGMFMPVWAGLAVFPLHAIARRTLGHGARWLAPAWALIPALLMFAPSWNTLYPLLTLIAFWMLLKGIERHSGWLIGSGFMTGLLTFFNFSTIPLIALFGFYTLLHYTLNVKDWKRAIAVGGWFALGLFSIWIIYSLWTRTLPSAMLSAAFDAHFELERSFIIGLWLHSWEWALFSGLPFVLLWLLVLFKREPGDDVLPQALFLTILLLLLSNTARGETGRVWLFFTPFVILAAGQMMRKWYDRSFKWLLPVAVHAVLLVALVATWNVMEAPDIRPRPDAPAVHENVTPITAHFDAGFTLTGWSAAYADGQITLNLNWYSDNQMMIPYYFAALPVAPDGATGEAVVWQPDATRYPTTCWLPDSVIGDTIQIPLPDDAPDGDWYISLSAFADVTNPMETVTIEAQGTPDRQIGLGPISVEN